MKRILVILLVLILTLSLCGCDTVDTVSSITTGDVHIERHYQDNGDLFCIVETNINSGVIVTTYFYWKHDNHGRRTLSSTECITVDSAGKVIAHVCSPGHS